MIDRIHEAANAHRLCDHRPGSCQPGESFPPIIASLPRTHFLTKPAKYSELIAAVELALGDKLPRAVARRRRGGERPPLQILLAEDGLVNQEVAVGLLEMRGHHVEIADNGREAIAALNGSRSTSC